MTQQYDWQTKSFDQLNTTELYDLLKLRIDVFVVEQTCYYPDLDDVDRQIDVFHHFAYDKTQLVGYCRIMAPEVLCPKASAIGRVIVAPNYRGQQLGYELMYTALQFHDAKWPGSRCHISAQTHLTKFYQSLGFSAVGEGYLEDGIPHIGMDRILWCRGKLLVENKFLQDWHKT